MWRTTVIGSRRRTNRARCERRGTPQGAPISPLLSNIYMRRFIVGWKVLGYARRFKAEIVNYADDFVVLGKAPAAEILAAVEVLMKCLKLAINVEKTRCCRVPEEAIEFLGYRIGRNYRRDTGRAYIGTRPSAASVRSICRRVSKLTMPCNELLSPEVVVERLNRLLTGWANYFILGQIGPAYKAIDRHAKRRLRRWLCRKHKVRPGNYVSPGRSANASRTSDCGRSTVSRALDRERQAFRGRRHDLVREPDAGDLHVRFDERRLETGLWHGVRHRHSESRREQLPPSAYRYRASCRLYKLSGGCRRAT